MRAPQPRRAADSCGQIRERIFTPHRNPPPIPDNGSPKMVYHVRGRIPNPDDPISNLLSHRAEVQLMEYGLYYPWAIGTVGFAEEAVVLLLWVRARISSVGFEGPAR